MLGKCLASPEPVPGRYSDLLKIKHMQMGLKLQLEKILEDAECSPKIGFDEKEPISSRAALNKQIRFPKVPKRRPISTRRLRAPSAVQASAVKANLDCCTELESADGGSNTDVVDAILIPGSDFGTYN